LSRHAALADTKRIIKLAARRAILLIGGLIVAGVLAMHFLAPEPEHQAAAAPVATTR
jgi:hypothetical protein